MKSIRPKMNGLEEVFDGAVIVIEATREEAAAIGHLLFSDVSIRPAANYIEDSDPVSAFIKRYCNEDTFGSIAVIDFYDMFCCWYQQTTGNYCMSQKRLGSIMLNKHCRQKVAGLDRFVGLSFQDPRNHAMDYPGSEVE